MATSNKCPRAVRSSLTLDSLEYFNETGLAFPPESRISPMVNKTTEKEMTSTILIVEKYDVYSLRRFFFLILFF